MGIYNAYFLSISQLENYLLRTRDFKKEDYPKIKLIFNDDGKYPYRPYQMYQIAIALQKKEVKEIIKDLNRD